MTLFKSRRQSLKAAGPQQNNLLHRVRPDIAIETRDTLAIIELTWARETNTAKYMNLRRLDIKN